MYSRLDRGTGQLLFQYAAQSPGSGYTSEPSNPPADSLWTSNNDVAFVVVDVVIVVDVVVVVVVVVDVDVVVVIVVDVDIVVIVDVVVVVVVVVAVVVEVVEVVGGIQDKPLMGSKPHVSLKGIAGGC